MKKIYVKPKLRPKELRKHLLTTASNLHVGGYGKLDSKECSFGFYEDEEDEEYYE